MRLLALAAALLATPCLAAPVEMPVDVPDGGSWTVDTTRVRVDERKDGPRRVESASRYQVTYRAQPEGGRLSLKPVGGSIFGDLPVSVDSTDIDTPVELEVDDSLSPLRITNWPAVREMMFHIISKVDARTAEAMRPTFDRISGEEAATFMLPNMSFLGLGQGLRLEPGKATTYEDELPNPLGGPAVKTNAAFLLESLDRKAGRAVVSWKQAFDQPSLRASLRQAAQAMLSRMGGEATAAKIDEQMQQMSVDRQNSCRFEIDLKTGLASKTQCSTVIDLGVQGEHQRRTDTWTITQTSPST